MDIHNQLSNHLRRKSNHCYCGHLRPEAQGLLRCHRSNLLHNLKCSDSQYPHLPLFRGLILTMGKLRDVNRSLLLLDGTLVLLSIVLENKHGSSTSTHRS